MAFTELGVAMLSSVLHSKRAVHINIEIMRVFVELRREQRRLDLVPKLESMENMFKLRFDRLESQIQNQTQPTTSRASAFTNHLINTILNAVARHFGLGSDDLRSASRTQAISLPRQIAIYLARKDLGISFSEIGRHFDGRDHTTVLHAYRKNFSEVETNTMIRSTVDALGSAVEQWVV